MIDFKQPIRKDEMGHLGSWLIFVLHGWSALGPHFPITYILYWCDMHLVM